VKHLQQILSGTMLVALLGGCATTGANPADPWEGANRKVYAFNDKLDSYALKPIAQGYKAVLPLPARTGISNFFGNIDDVWISFNNLVQGKPSDSLNDIGRFAINSTIGILGLFDIATEMGLEKHDEDFGQTLAVWGVGDGPYVVLPLLGPSTVRDAGGTVIDKLVYTPNSLISSVPERNSLTVLRLVNARSKLLGMENTLDEASLDKYAFVRNFYLQNRRSLIYDGQPPRQRDEDDYFDDAAPAEPAAPAKVEDQKMASPEAVPEAASAPVSGHQ
jgi:phospholipid-binding lipoprotein MlaA